MTNETLKKILHDIVFNENNVFNGHYQTVFPVMTYRSVRNLVELLQSKSDKDYLWEIRLYPEMDGKTSCTVYRNSNVEQIVFGVEQVEGV